MNNSKMSCHICGRSNRIGRDCFFKNQFNRGGRGRGRGRVFQKEKQAPTNNQPGKPSRIKKEHRKLRIICDRKICEKNVKWLVDCGATLTILSTSLYNSIKSSLGGDNALARVKKEIVSATNESIRVTGKTELSLQIGQKMYKQVLAIAEVRMDGVIGLDFTNKYKCTLDAVNKKLLIDSEEVKLISEVSLGSY